MAERFSILHVLGSPTLTDPKGTSPSLGFPGQSELGGIEMRIRCSGCPGRQARHPQQPSGGPGWESSVGWLCSPDHEARLREHIHIVRPARAEQCCPD